MSLVENQHKMDEEMSGESSQPPEDSKDSEDFTPREYQVEIFEKAIKQNSIIYMPTGSGKTFIAAMLIKHFASNVQKKFSEGGKRSFFLVNTVPLVHQQAISIRRQLPLEVGEYNGKTITRNGEFWENELEKKQVLVMTSAIFFNLIVHNQLKLSNVNLLILDECHHAVNNHIMRQIMQLFENTPENERPHILGLTATLLNSNCKPEEVEKEIHELEITLHSSVITALNHDMVQLYSTNPGEEVITYINSNDASEGDECVLECIEFLITALSKVEFYDVYQDHDKSGDNALLNHGKSNNYKKLLSNIKDIEMISKELGVYAASKAALSKIILMERLKLACSKSMKVMDFRLLSVMTTRFHLLRKKLQLIMDKIEPGEQPIHFSTSKLQALFKILENFDPENLAIVFVECRVTAKVLHYIFQELQQHNDKFKGIHSDFIVGCKKDPFKDTRELIFEQKMNVQTLKRFNSKRTNVLFASNILEEGLDVPNCNFVIKFDAPNTFRSYIQSKGRARHQNSKYILIVGNDQEKFFQNYNEFKFTEEIVKQTLCGGKADYRLGGSEGEAKEFLYNFNGQCYYSKDTNGPCVTPLSAVALINRYCNTLPQDKFSKLTSQWWLKKLTEPDGKKKYVATLQLPINSAIKDPIQGAPCDNEGSAKKSVALKACELLHKAGELDDNLFPRGKESELLTDKSLYPMWDYDDNSDKHKPGTKKCRRIYEKHFPRWLWNCRPVSDSLVFLHLIHMTPNYEYPEGSRQQAFYNLLNSKKNFSLLTSKRLPQICQFPMFMNVGEVTINVKVNIKTIRLTTEEISLVFDFHCLLFTDVLPLVKKFCMRDYENEENSYIITPTLEDDNGELEIDWNSIITHTSLPEVKPATLEERQGIVVKEENYMGKIVVPWYRPKGNCMRYIVTRVCFEESPESPFPSDNYQSYAQYFLQRYNQRIVNANQPLIEVRAISSKINCLLPRGKFRQGGTRKRRGDDEIEETLVPELCFLMTFPAEYMLKVTLLPSVLHRLYHLLLAEELRRKIAKETGLGVVDLLPGKEWDPVTVDNSALIDEESDGLHSTIQISDMLNENIEAITKEKYPWGNEQEPPAIEKDNEVDLMSIIHYEQFVSQPVTKEQLLPVLVTNNVKPKKPSHRAPLNISKTEPENVVGPQQCEILQALTGSIANDIFNFERLETLGDSFLKFAISLSLFTNYNDKDEGQLSMVKSKLSNNQNLFYCGKNVELGKILKVYNFSPDDWNVPGFTLLRSVQTIMKETNIPSAILYQIALTQEERDSGTLSESTFITLHELLLNAQEVEDNTHSALAIVGQQGVSDKSIADAVESIIGVYLKSCGIEGALKMINWLGILPAHMCDIDQLLNQKAPTALLNPTANVDDYLILPEILEETLGYKFNDRSYLLQALTHPSVGHNVTDCYQRLELLGDAILDFLITAHIYENFGDLSPGELTDLRSSLVNNVTFACLAVRNGIHKHLIAKTCKLADIVNRFANHQESRNHAIGAEVLFLLEESEVQVAESIDVPKVLGDLFESLAAAIYLDSNKSLSTVWDVIYSLMANEIEQFSKNVPKNHLRLLYEQFVTPSPKFGKVTILSDCSTVMISLEVFYNNVTKVFHGVGENKSCAMLAAAKLALRYFHTKTKEDDD